MKIDDDSHLDHLLSPAHLAWVMDRFGDRTAFFAETVELPEGLPELRSSLHGPAAGDAPVPEEECTHLARGGRGGPSRLCARPRRPTRLLTVVAGPHGAHPCVLYTAFGGPPAPREPWDPSLDDSERAASVAFWSEHALSA